MGFAQQANARHRRLAATSDRIQVVEFEELARPATPPALADERALALIALPDGALHLGRNMAGIGAAGCPAAARPWLRGRRELLLLELPRQGIEGPVEHLRDIARRELVAHQRLDVLELLVRGPSDRELEREAPGRKRLDPGLRDGRLNWPRGQLTGDREGLDWPRGQLTGDRPHWPRGP